MPASHHSLTQDELASLDQALIGLIPAAELPGSGDVAYLDEEGTPVAERTGGEVRSLRNLRWMAPDGSAGTVAVATAGEVPAEPLSREVTLLLPVGGVRPDDSRTRDWAATWRAAAASTIEVPIQPRDAADWAARLAASYGNGELATVHTLPMPRGNGRVVLLTGFSGSGKSTIARALVEAISDSSVTLLDGDVVRTHLTKGLGFSREDRDTNVRRIGWVAAEIAKHGGLVVCAPIAPYDQTRRWVRSIVDAAGGPSTFVLVWVSTPLSVCESRDVKGLYAKARAGELKGFTGIDDPYEEPADADLVINTADVALDDAVAQILEHLDR